MKKLFRCAVVIAVLALPAISLAAQFRAGQQPAIEKNEQITNDMYMAGGSIISAGNITGDLVSGGGNIIVSGNVGADVIAGGGNVSIFGTVGDDVRVAGGNIVIQGKVGGDVIAAGGQMSIGGPGISGDVAIVGGDIIIDAPIMGKLTARAGSVFINAPISGDINIESDVVKLGNAAVISGNITYKAKHEIVKGPGAVINGKISFEPRMVKDISPEAFAAIFSAFIIWKFFAILACALLFGLVFRRYSKEIINLAVKRPLLELGRGLVVLAAMPAISILLFVTLVGVPLGILGLLGFAAMMLFACIVTPIVVGSVVYRYFSKKDLEISWKTILLGVFISSVLGLVPFIGWLAQSLLMLLTLGCIASLKWQIIKGWR